MGTTAQLAIDSGPVAGDRLPTLQPGTVLAMRPVAVAAMFGNETLDFANSLLDEVVWNVGVDQQAEIRDLTDSLQADWRLIDRGIRDDDFIRTRATATLRRLSTIFRKADAMGLVNYGASIDPAALSCPDYYDGLLD